MPLDDLPAELIIPQRDDIREQYLRDVRIRTPGAVTVEGTKEHNDASLFADQALPLYYNTKTIGDHVASRNKSGRALDDELALAGLTRLPAAGASGYVQITASAGGGTIFVGDEIKDSKSQLRFKCIATNLYVNGSLVPVIGIDTGPETNLDPNVKLQWTNPRPGIGPNATVVEQADGTGLSGGRSAETTMPIIRRLFSRHPVLLFSSVSHMRHAAVLDQRVLLSRCVLRLRVQIEFLHLFRWPRLVPG